MPADLLLNIDVGDLARGIAFYRDAFGLTVSRRLGPGIAEMVGWPVKIYLLEKAEGTIGAASEPRRYVRHWTPVHFDVVVENVDLALTRAVAVGGRAETRMSTYNWGKLVVLSDPFGNGFCLVEFIGRGYDELAT